MKTDRSCKWQWCWSLDNVDKILSTAAGGFARDGSTFSSHEISQGFQESAIHLALNTKLIIFCIEIKTPGGGVSLLKGQ